MTESERPQLVALLREYADALIALDKASERVDRARIALAETSFPINGVEAAEFGPKAEEPVLRRRTPVELRRRMLVEDPDIETMPDFPLE